MVMCMGKVPQSEVNYRIIHRFLCKEPSFYKELAGTSDAGHFPQKDLEIYASAFIEIYKLFETFLKIHPSKSFKNYEYIICIHISIILCYILCAMDAFCYFTDDLLPTRLTLNKQLFFLISLL